MKYQTSPATSATTPTDAATIPTVRVVLPSLATLCADAGVRFPQFPIDRCP